MASTSAHSSTSGSRVAAGSAGSGTGDVLAAAGEFAVIGAVTAGRTQPVSTLLGPGDDAAVVRAGDGRVVCTVDMAVEGVHFRTDWSDGEQIGRRAALAAMADVAAMGGRPTALLVALGAPAQTPVALVRQIGDGLHAAAAEAGAGVVGGDLTSAPAITISVTVLGDLDGRDPVLRSGAEPGDLIAVCGRIGWAAAGFTVLSRGFRSPAQAVAAFRVPDPPLAAGPVAAAAGATAMVDMSDGLLADLGHIAAASGVSMSVLTAGLQVPPRLAEVASALGKDPMSWLLTGGEDHALAATFPSGTEPPDGWLPIGTVGPPSGPGEPAVTVDGAAYEGSSGWDHFGPQP